MLSEAVLFADTSTDTCRPCLGKGCKGCLKGEDRGQVRAREEAAARVTSAVSMFHEILSSLMGEQVRAAPQKFCGSLGVGDGS